MSKLQAVLGPPRRPPRYGLLVSAPPIEAPQLPAAPDTDKPGTWELWGIQWQPEACGTTSGRRSSPCNGNTTALDPGTQPATVGATPFVVFAADECSLLGGLGRDRRGRAIRALNATRSYQVAQELWAGALLAADTDPDADRLVLTDPASDTVSPTVGGGLTAVDGLGCLEQGYAECSQGGQGMVHCTPSMLTHWALNGAIRREGNVWLTATDNLVVADAGYTGAGPGNVPAGATQWAYATDMIRVGLGVQITTPAEGEYPMPDLATNDLVVYAQQWALYTADRCCHLAVELQLPVCAIGAPS